MGNGAVEHAWTVLCDRTSEDAATHNLRLEVVEQLQVVMPALPKGAAGFALPYKPALATLWSRSDADVPAKLDSRIGLVGPTGKALIEPVKHPVDLTTAVRARSIVNFDALPIVGPGVYRFIVEVREGTKWRRVAAVPLQVLDLAAGQPLVFGQGRALLPPTKSGKRATKKRRRKR